MIHEENYTAVIQVQRCRRLHGSVADMEFECQKPIAQIKIIPQGLCRSLEVWACSPRGVLRFFRITGTGLIELRKNGEPMNTNGGTASGAPGVGGT
jgi:hypothetical protein